MFFSPLSIGITSLGEERTNISAFVRLFDLRLFGFVFPLPLGVREGLRPVIVAIPGLFFYLFTKLFAKVISRRQKSPLARK